MMQKAGTIVRPVVLAETRSVHAQTTVCWHFGGMNLRPLAEVTDECPCVR